MNKPRRRFHARAIARRHYVDPLLLQEGYYRSRLEAAELYLDSARRIRLRLPGCEGQPLPLAFPLEA